MALLIPGEPTTTGITPFLGAEKRTFKVQQSISCAAELMLKAGTQPLLEGSGGADSAPPRRFIVEHSRDG
jgi:hypothetical protein